MFSKEEYILMLEDEKDIIFGLDPEMVNDAAVEQGRKILDAVAQDDKALDIQMKYINKISEAHPTASIETCRTLSTFLQFEEEDTAYLSKLVFGR